MYVRANRTEDCFEVVQCHHEHNHETGPEIFYQCLENKQLNETEKEQLQKMLKLNVKTHVMKQSLRQSSGKLISSKQIHNIRAKLEKADVSMSDEDHLCQELKSIVDSDLGAVTQVLVDEDQSVIGIYVQTSYMLNTFKKFPELCFLDATYKTNNYQMPLFTLMIEDGNGISIPVAHFWVVCERAAVFRQSFFLFYEA